MALLGKISAVLTANTQDFTKKIGLAKNEISDFAKKVSGVQLNLNTRALDGTLTKLQKFQKTVQELRQLRANGIDLGIDPKRLQDQFRAFEDVGKPLTALKTKIEGLSNTLQAGLYPELGKIQAGFRNLYREIESGATTFDKSQGRVQSLLSALTRLTRATSAAQDIGNLAGKLGQENVGASFFQPRAKEALQNSLSLREQATQVPARFRGGAFADLADEAERNAQRIEEQAARILRVQLRIAREGETASNLNARSQAQAGMDALTRQQEAINSLFSRELRSAQIKEIISPEATSGAEKATSRFAALSKELRKIDEARFESLIVSVGRVVEKLNNAQASAAKAKAALEALSATRVAANIERSLTSRADAALGDESVANREAIQRAATLQRSQIYKDQSLSPGKRASRAAVVNASEQAMLERESFNRNILGRVGSLPQMAAETGDASLGKRAEDLRRNAVELNSLLKSASSSTDAAFKTQKLDEYKAKLSALVGGLDAFDASAKRAASSQKQFQQFLSASGGRGDKLDPTLEGAASDIMVARQFRGQFGRDNDTGRVAVAKQIEQAEERIQSLIKRRQQIESASTGNESKRAAAYKRVTDLIEQQTKAVLERVAAESGGQFSQKQVMAAATRARKSAGSLGLGGVAAAQLAFQQAAFAVDDFVSATGGVEYKLRAVGNNITQLGLLLGQSGLIPGLTATQGLFISLGVVLASQVGVQILKFALGAEKTDETLKSLNDTLTRQKSAVKELADAYRDLAKSLRDAGSSDIGRTASGRDAQIEDLRRKRNEATQERVASVSPDIQGLRADRQILEKRLEESSSIPDRVRFQQQIQQNRDRERRLLDAAGKGLTAGGLDSGIQSAAADAVTIATRAKKQLEYEYGAGATPESTAQAQAVLDRAIEARKELLFFNPKMTTEGLSEARVVLQRQLEDAIALRDSAGVDGAAGLVQDANRQIENISRLLAAVDGRLSGAFDKVDEALTRGAFRVSDSLASAQGMIASAFGDAVSSSALRAEMDRTSDTLGMLRKSASEATTPEEAGAFQQDIDALEAHAKKLLEAAMAVSRFSEDLDAFSQSVASDISSLQQRADDARRQDIVMGTPETADRRRQAEQDLANARQAGREFEDARASARERVEQQMMDGNDPMFRRLREIDAQLAVPAGGIDPNTGIKGGTVEERDRLRAERSSIQQEIDRRVAESPEMQTAGRRRDEVTAQAESAQAADRGRERVMTDGQRAARDFLKGVSDINAYVDERLNGIIDGANGLPGEEDRKKMQQIAQEGRDAQQRLFDEQARQAAPAIYEMADAVKSAVAQGPSRAAMNAADVSSVEGARELSRLLRGDDAALQQANIAELQKQSEILRAILDAARDEKVVDIR